MEGFGVFLKRERELREIPLEEVSKVTKVKRSYLEAIEKDEYDFLPGIAFVKGFIKSYASYIGIDSNDALLRFQIYYEELNGEKQKKAKGEGYRILKNRVEIVIMILLFAILLFAVIMY